MFIPDPESEFLASRIRIKEFQYFNPKKYDPGCSFRILMLIFYPSQIPDPGVKKAPDPGVKNAPDPGSGSATLF
jgi:hypothetical protein